MLARVATMGVWRSGSAGHLQCQGRRFKSCYLHLAGIKVGGPANSLQKSRMGFDSPRSFHFIPLASKKSKWYHTFMTLFEKVWFRFTKCDSGDYLNPLMHLFLLITLVFGIAFVFFGDTTSVQASVLYMNSAEWFGWNQFGLSCLAAMVAHTASFMLRGKWNLYLLPTAMAFGFFAWLYASIIYLDGGFFFQFAVACFPNLLFWVWYSFQFSRRARGKNQAFVH